MDAFPDAPEDFGHASRFFQSLTHSAISVEVTPIYIFQVGEIMESFPGRSKKSQAAVKGFVEAARRSLQKSTEALGLNGIRFNKPVVVPHPSSNPGSSARAFEKVVRTSGYQLVVMNTHARHGFSRWILGSFAESFVLEASVPTIILNPKAKEPQGLKTLFLATDLSDKSETSFLSLLNLASAVKGEVVLYHKLIDRFQPLLAMASPMAGVTLPESVLRKAEARSKALHKISRLEKRAEAAEIPMRIILDDTLGSISESILAAAKNEKASLIAVTARSGLLASALIGSVSRQVVRTSEVPVLILHTKKGGSAKKTSSRGFGSGLLLGA